MAKKPKLTDYKYVDVWYSDKNGQASPWTRILLEEVKQFQQEEAYNFNCFATIQQFASKSGVKGESFIAPLYFDLDYEGDPEKARVEAVQIIEFFMGELDIEAQDLKIYFSGSKGFHIIVEAKAFGIRPRNDLHKVYKHIAGYLRYRLGATIKNEEGEEEIDPLKSVDLKVYTSKRMLRLPNSMHQKTRLFKTRLTITELQKLKIDQIKELAAEPRRDTDFNDDAGTKERTQAVKFYDTKLGEYEQAAATANNNYDDSEYIFEKEKQPECVKDILNGGWKKEGDRNQATVQLTCYFKAAGHTKEEALEILEPWVIKHTSAKSNYQQRQRVSNTRNVVDSIYNNDSDYAFGCAFIRSLHGEKRPNQDTYERVACAGNLCPALKENNEDEEEAIPLHLAETGDAEYTGTLVSTRIMIAGKRHTPYIVPSRIEYTCWGRDNCKKTGCPLYNIPSGVAYRDLGTRDRELIQMCGIGDDNIKGILKGLSGIYTCKKFGVERVDTTNVEEIMAIPKAEEIAAMIDYRDTSKDGTYVLRTVYAIGGIANLEENKHYNIKGYVYPHPKDQQATILIKEAEPLQDVVDSFEITEEQKERLKIFQPEDYTVEKINEKLQDIMNDLTYNVTRIVERDETLLAALLVYHSVLRFKVPWDSLPIRGWLELAVIGDTGTGKSALMEKLQAFCKLGSRVNAESTSRTGLTYKMEQSGSGGAWYIVWGAWPLADKELIWIDECTGISQEEYGQMTMARSEGKLEVKRAVTAETPSRVRAILTGNVPFGKRLSDYGQGVEALKDIFNNEDIRRFDFSVFMKSTDVDPELYNNEIEEYPETIKNDDLKNNILFAWSRNYDQVNFTADTIDTILEGSTELSKIYGNANDVPLVSPSDQRNKLARLSTALAALTHSVDESGERLQVWPGHVEYIIGFLKGIYNAPGAGLNYYARLAVKEEELDEDKYEKITNYLKSLDTLKSVQKFYEFISLFSTQRYLRLGNVEAMLSIDKEEAKAIVNLLAKLRMVVMTSGGYRKTARFNSYIAKCFEVGVFDNVEFDLI